jgi:hypothetical protein
MNQNLMLLEDCCDGTCLTIDLNESNVEKGLIKFKGKFQEAEAINKNKRMYPFAVLDENVQKLNEVVKARGLVGELDHPTDSIIHFKEASHVITKLFWEGHILQGEGEILNTAHGRQLKALISDGVRVGISSRGVGNGKVNENGVLVISEGYKLITFDAVADPSTFNAFQERVTAAKRENVIVPKNYEDYIVKNEKSSIHKISKEAVIAAFGGIIKEHTNKIKVRIK